MEKFAIARERELIHPEIGEYRKQTVYLRIEPNGNLFWTIHLETATQFEHAEAEEILQIRSDLALANCYLVPAPKTEEIQ